MNLAARLRPCGPVVDPAAAARAHEDLGGPEPWEMLAPVFAASPYLTALGRRDPARLASLLADEPDARLADLLARTAALGGGAEAVSGPLRRLKAELHLLTALADLGGVWPLERVTGALSAFADAAVASALRSLAHDLRARGVLTSLPDDPRGPLPGLFLLAMGKHGAGELNYSSDIDVSVFWEPEVVQAVLSGSVEPQRIMDRLAQGLATLLSKRTGEGYVFRTDLRLRPDPSSTPPAVAAPMALAYYESVGQNWERAAFIKARPLAGDLAEARAFLDALKPFVWRRSLDYPAILDIQSIKRQIHAWKTGQGLSAGGANLKLGRGGIREIEFYAQTQQLILGGRDPSLRAPRTVEALAALAAAARTPPEVAEELTAAYRRLRDLEHRVQMLDDEQSHVLPLDPDRRRAVAALAGADDLVAFDAGVEALLRAVNARYGELFSEEEDLSSQWGSLVFTGVENDPETLQTLTRMGFDDPAAVSATIRAWHHGRIPATRSARGRELFTRLAPRLLTAAAETGAPNAAFTRFSTFFAGLTAGLQVQALFLNQPELFTLLVRVMAFAPRLARQLGRHPATLDSILDERFLAPLEADTGVLDEIVAAAGDADFEEAMNRVRRAVREQVFRIGLQTILGRAGAEAAGWAFTALADAALAALAPAALREAERLGGACPGAVAVVALGKAGSREMTAASDLDLMTVFEAPDGALSAARGWPADVFYARFTQRLVAALSTQTAEGGLYEVDMRLRPSGSAGPVSVSLPAIELYYRGEADTWEFLALTRARVAWASDPGFGARVADTIEAALRRRRRGVKIAADVLAMRRLMDRERPPRGFWDMKLSPGGLVDAEFAAQLLQLKAALAGKPLTVSTLEALAGEPRLAKAWRLQQRLAQVLACALEETGDVEAEPAGLKQRLAEAGGAVDFTALQGQLEAVRRAARARLLRLLGA